MTPDPIEAGPGVLSAEERLQVEALKEAWAEADRANVYTDAACADVAFLVAIIDRLLPLAEEGREEGIVWLDGQRWRLQEHADVYEDSWGDTRVADMADMDDPDIEVTTVYRLVSPAPTPPGEPTGDAGT